MFERILVVCVGNMCRSPTGEALLRKYLPQKEITSAGIAAPIQRGAASASIAQAQKHGLDLSAHRTRQLTASLCRKADLILVMERSHIEAVARLAPEARGKTMLFAHWLPEKEIYDPYGRSDEAFAHVYTCLDDAANLWLGKLR